MSCLLALDLLRVFRLGPLDLPPVPFPVDEATNEFRPSAWASHLCEALVAQFIQSNGCNSFPI